MKRFFSTTMMLFVAIATLSLTSCKKEASELIIGKWDTQVATLTTTDTQDQVETTDLSPIFKGFEFAEGGTGNALVQLDENGITPLPCTWTIEEDQLNVIITDMQMTMALTITEIDKDSMILDNSNEVYGVIMAMHFEMKKAE